MFCTFIFAVLLLKYFFPTGDQLQRYCASDLLSNGVTEQTRGHASGMTSPLVCIADNSEQNSFYIHKMAKK